MLGSEGEAGEEQALSKEGNPKRGASGQEHSVSLDKSTRVERTSAPRSSEPPVSIKAGLEEVSIPRVCVHAWTGYT